MTPDANGLEPEQKSKRELIAENQKLREILRRLVVNDDAYYRGGGHSAHLRFRAALTDAREALR